MVSGSNGSPGDLSPNALDVVYTLRHVIRSEPIDDSLALRHARALLLEPLRGISQEGEYSALTEALASDAVLSAYHGDPRFERAITESEFRAHLHRVLGHLDAMRPWQEPVLRVLDPGAWHRYPGARVIGRLTPSILEVENRIRTHFVPETGSGGERVEVAVLRLRGGHEVALVGRRLPSEVVEVASRDPEASPADLMAELTSGSHFEPGEFEVVE